MIKKILLLASVVSITAISNFASADEPIDLVPAGPEEAKQSERSCIEDKDALACFSSGIYHNLRKGEGIDHELAVKYLELSCRYGFPIACGSLGIKYQQGEGVPKDLRKAAALFVSACEKKYVIGCLKLADLYFEGKVFKKDRAKALEIYNRICDEGVLSVCGKLYGLYGLGKGGVKRDGAKVFQYGVRICEASEENCNLLAVLYEEAIGVERDYKKALELFKRSCAAGNTATCESVEIVRKKMRD